MRTMLKNPIKITKIAPFLGLLILLGWAYGGSLKNGFVIDDAGQIIERPILHDLKNLPAVLKNEGTNEARYLPQNRPVSGAFRMVLYALFKKDPFYYHLTNLILFLLYCSLIFILVWKLTREPTIAWITTALVGVHPLNATPVNYVSAEEVLLFGIFAMASVIFFILSVEKGGKAVFFILSVVFFILSLLTQEIMAVFPVYIFLIAFMLRKKSVKSSLLISLPYALFVALYLFYRYAQMPHGPDVFHRDQWAHLPFFSYTATVFKLIFWYVSKIFVPGGIVLIWGTQPTADGAFLYNLLGAGAVLVTGLLIKRWGMDLKSFSLLWFIAGFIPVTLTCLIYPSIGLVIEPHWFFFSLVGLILLAVILMKELTPILPKTIFILALTGVLFFLAAVTHGYTRLFKDDKSYCQYWLKYVPHHRRINFWLADAYLKEKDYARAEFYYKKALVKDFNDWQVFINLGLIAYERKESAKAFEYFSKALLINPKSGLAHHDLGLIYRDRNDLDEARRQFQQAITLDPYLLNARLNLAWIYRTEGRIKESMEMCEENLRIDSHHVPCHLALIEMNLLTRQDARARELAEEILRKNRDPKLIPAVKGLFAQYHEQIP